ncbi:MAG: caspase family protein [Vulcanimicrobiota bacterium]
MKKKVSTPDRPAFIGIAISVFILLIITTIPGLPLSFQMAENSSASSAQSSKTHPELLVQNGHSAGLLALAWSPDSTLLATGSQDQTAKLWEMPSGKVKDTLAGHRLKEGNLVYYTPVTALAFSPDGRTLATGSKDNTIVTWNVKTGRKKSSLSGQSEQINGLAFSIDGKTLISGGEDNTIRFWNIESAKEESSINTEHDVMAVAASPQGNFAAVGCGKEIYLIDFASHKEKGRIKLPGNVLHLAFSTDGSLLASSLDDKTLRICEVKGASVLSTIKDEGVTVGISFVPKSTTLAVASYDNIKLWSCSGKNTQLIKTIPYAGVLAGLSISPNGKYMAGADVNGWAPIWDLGSFREVARLAGRSSNIYCFSISPDADLLAAGVQKGATVVWDLSTGSIESVFPGDASVMSVALSKKGTSIASGYRTGILKVWDVKTKKLLMNREDAHKGYVNCIAFSPDGSFTASGGEDNKAKIWDLESGKLRASLEHPGDVTSISFTPDGLFLITTCMDGIIRQWDLSTRRVLIERKPGMDSSYKRSWSSRVSPNGRMIATGLQDGTVKIWETSTEEPLYELSTETRRPIYEVDFSPDNRMIAASTDGIVMLWDISQPKARVVASLDGDRQVQFSGKGKILITGSSTGTLEFWKASSGQLLADAVILDEGQEWVVTSPNGLFDGSPQGMKLIEWRINDRIYSLDQFYNSFYTPGLLSRILTGLSTESAEASLPAPGCDITGLKPPPRVRILTPKTNQSIADPSVKVEVQLTEQQGGGISNPMLYLNGKRVPDTRKKDGVKGNVVFSVSTVNGLNRLRATAFNKDGTVESQGDEVRLINKKPGAKPNLHVLAVGIDKYQSGLELQYACKDAASISRFFKPGCYDSVNSLCLLDEKAGKQAVLDAMTKIAGEAQPEDSVILYFAGHGTSIRDMFYFLPWDAKTDTDTDIQSSSISSLELGRALSDIPATKQMLILDACNSGASTTSMGRILFTGDALDLARTQQRMVRNAGTFLIAASTAKQYAAEVPELGHGVLTYAILTGLGGDKKPQAALSSDGTVTVNSLLRYLSEEVPKLSQKYRGIRQNVVQFSTGQDFALEKKR